MPYNAFVLRRDRFTKAHAVSLGAMPCSLNGVAMYPVHILCEYG